MTLISLSIDYAHLERTWCYVLAQVALIPRIRIVTWIVALTPIAFSSPVFAQPAFTFSIPDGPIPDIPGDGLDGFLWSSPAIAPVDDLAATRSYIAANMASASFVSTAVDYPNGSTGSTVTTSLFSEGLGVDAASLSDPTVGASAVLNSILRFRGFLRIAAPGILSLGLASDDGSELRIQGTQVINNDGLHSFPGVPGPFDVEFTTPGLYGMEILFFESQESDWGVEFFLGGTSPVPVPTSMLQRSVPEPGMSMAVGILTSLILVRPRMLSRRRNDSRDNPRHPGSGA